MMWCNPAAAGCWASRKVTPIPTIEICVVLIYIQRVTRPHKSTRDFTNPITMVVEPLAPLIQLHGSDESTPPEGRAALRIFFTRSM